MMSAFEIACFLLLFSAVSLSTAAPEQDGKLHILSLSSDKLRAVYHLSAQEGIEITSQVSEEESHLSITTLAGEQLVSARSVADSSDIFWKIMGYSIFLHNNSLELQDGGTQRDMLEYVVPSTAADHVEKEMKKHHITPKLLRTLNTEIVEQTKQSAFLELFSRPEMDGVMAAVRVLGNTIKGYENPAALNLYSVRTQLRQASHPHLKRPPPGAVRNKAGTRGPDHHPVEEDGKASDLFSLGILGCGVHL